MENAKGCIVPSIGLIIVLTMAFVMFDLRFTHLIAFGIMVGFLYIFNTTNIFYNHDKDRD